MHLLSLGLWLAAAASLASASRCKPASSSSAVVSSSSSSSVPVSSGSSTSVSASSSSSSAPLPLATFNLVADSSDPVEIGINGVDLESDGDNQRLLFNGTDIGYTTVPFHLESGTNHLMVSSYYVCWRTDGDSGLWLETVADIAAGLGLYVQVGCSPAYQGVDLSCVAKGYPAVTAFIVVTALSVDSPVGMYDPNSVPPGANTIGLLPKPI